MHVLPEPGDVVHWISYRTSCACGRSTLHDQALSHRVAGNHPIRQPARAAQLVSFDKHAHTQATATGVAEDIGEEDLFIIAIGLQ